MRSFRMLVTVPAAALSLATVLVPASAFGTTASWLEAVNQVRTGSGLTPVTADASKTAGMAQHIKYLEHDQRWQTGPYADLHDENPAAPDYTAAGLHAGETSVIAFDTRNDEAAVDGWLAAPIHASDMLKPDLTSIGYYRDPVSGDAMLTTDGGLDGTDQVIEYPGNGATTQLTLYGGESPDPTASCPAAYRSGAGLPLFAVLPDAPPSTSTATLTVGAQSVPVCVLDQNNFNAAADPVYGPTALQYFQSGLVLIIPREQLVPGDYTVDLQPGGEDPVSWSFHSDPKAMPPSLGSDALCSYTNPRYASGQVQVGITNPRDTTKPATYSVRLGAATKSVKVADGSFGHTSPFTKLKVGTYRASVTGSDGTSGVTTVKVLPCPAWSAVHPAPGGGISVAKHLLRAPISNKWNKSAVTLTVKRSHLSTLKFHLPGESTRVLRIGLHKHGPTKLTFKVGAHTLDRTQLTLP